ncbi:MAG: hypothetical protein AAF747_08215 [Planctomycetota bacterium]
MQEPSQWHDWLTNYYGVDWAAMIFTMLSAWRLGSKHADGWIWAMLSAISWIAFNFLVESGPAIFANVVFLALNARGFIAWLNNRSDEPKSDEPNADEPNPDEPKSDQA